MTKGKTLATRGKTLTIKGKTLATEGREDLGDHKQGWLWLTMFHASQVDTNVGGKVPLLPPGPRLKSSDSEISA